MSAPTPTHRILARLTLLLGLLGAGVSIYLTHLKYRQLAYPCIDPSAGCRLSKQFDCADALASSWSMFLNLPLSLWGTAFYALIIAIVLGRSARPQLFSGGAPTLLLALATCNLGVSLVLFGYSAQVLGTYCPFCLGLYAISFLLWLVTAGWCHKLRSRGAEPWTRTWRRPGVRLDAFFFSTMVFIYVAGAQSVVLNLLRKRADPQAGCPVLSQLPDTRLSFGTAPADDKPDLVLALFVDLSCLYCKRDFSRIVDLERAGALAGVQVRVFHIPRAACNPAAFPGGFPASHPEALQQQACLAAIAVECSEELRPGTGIDMLRALYAQHELPSDGQPLFRLHTLRVLARKLELDSTEPESPFTRCLNGTDALARVSAHQRFVVDQVWHRVDDARVPIEILIPLHRGRLDFPAARFLPPDIGKQALLRLISDLRRAREETP